MERASFGVWDYVVFGVMLVASLCIGVYHAVRGRNQTTSEYLVAGRSMTFLPVAFSIVASFCSSILMIGNPAEGYAYGMSYSLGILGSSIGAVTEIVIALAFVRRLKMLTTNEYLERRFQSRTLRVLANIVTCISQLFYMSVVLYGSAIALKTITGLSIYASIVVTGGAAIVYTTIGGLKAVIWTDVLQLIIMILGILTTIIMGTVYAGGISEVWTRALDSGRLNISLDPDPTVRFTLWNLLFGKILSGFGNLTSAASFQRICSLKSLKHATWSLLLTLPLFFLMITTATVEGVVAYAYFSHKGCDPMESKQIDSPNQIVPILILDLYQNLPGMPGLFMAALASASLSTISSCLSAIANITWYDLFQPSLPQLSEFKSLLIAKTTVVVFGVLGCILSVAISLARSHTLIQISSTFDAVTRSPLIALFYVGAIFPFVNTKGAITGLLTGMAVMTWLSLGSMMTPSTVNSPYAPFGPTDQCPVNMSSPTESTESALTTPTMVNVTKLQTTSKSGLEWFYGLSFTLFISIAIAVVILTGVLVSLLTGGWKSRTDPELVIHADDFLWRTSRRRSHRSPEKHSEEPVAFPLL